MFRLTWRTWGASKRCEIGVSKVIGAPPAIVQLSIQLLIQVKLVIFGIYIYIREIWWYIYIYYILCIIYIYIHTYFYIGEPNDDKLFWANMGTLNDDKFLFFWRSMLPYWVSSLPKFWRQQVLLEQPERWKSLRLKLFVVLRCLWQQWDSWQHHGPLPLCGNEIESRVDIRIQNCKAWLLCWKIWFVWDFRTVSTPKIHWEIMAIKSSFPLFLDKPNHVVGKCWLYISYYGNILLHSINNYYILLSPVLVSPKAIVNHPHIYHKWMGFQPSKDW